MCVIYGKREQGTSVGARELEASSLRDTGGRRLEPRRRRPENRTRTRAEAGSAARLVGRDGAQIFFPGSCESGGRERDTRNLFSFSFKKKRKTNLSVFHVIRKRSFHGI